MALGRWRCITQRCHQHRCQAWEMESLLEDLLSTCQNSSIFLCLHLQIRLCKWMPLMKGWFGSGLDSNLPKSSICTPRSELQHTQSGLYHVVDILKAIRQTHLGKESRHVCSLNLDWTFRWPQLELTCTIYPKSSHLLEEGTDQMWTPLRFQYCFLQWLSFSKNLEDWYCQALLWDWHSFKYLVVANFLQRQFKSFWSALLVFQSFYN